MTSQGQRFRRRALRRGYKVDEVDAFLDRVEATLAGESIGAVATAQEVHDVVFRVRFGGYDEWQVDLHLDRVERQLGDLEERTGGFARTPAARGGFTGLRDERLEIRRSTMPAPPMPQRPLTPAAQMSGLPCWQPMLPPMMARRRCPPRRAPMSSPPCGPCPPRCARCRGPMTGGPRWAARCRSAGGGARASAATRQTFGSASAVVGAAWT